MQAAHARAVVGADATPARRLSLVRNTTGSTPRTAQESSELDTITFTVHKAHAPALRSVVEDMSNEVGGRLEGQLPFPLENSLTKAAVALGQLRAAVCAAVPVGDADYISRGRR